MPSMALFVSIRLLNRQPLPVLVPTMAQFLFTPTTPSWELMGDNGKRGPKPQVTDDEILTVFREADDPVLIASEVAEHLPIKRRGVYDRLKDLREQGKIKSKKVGGRSTVWWYPGHTDTPPENNYSCRTNHGTT